MLLLNHTTWKPRYHIYFEFITVYFEIKLKYKTNTNSNSNSFYIAITM